MTKEESHRKASRKYSLSHPEKILEYQRIWRKRRNNWLLELKKNKKCISCEENNPVCLDFHHKDPKTKSWNIRNLIERTSNNERVMEEINKCELLCANCHRKHHAKNPAHMKKSL